MAFHELDPDGDILLTLHNPNAPFAVWDFPGPETKAESEPEPIVPLEENSCDKSKVNDTESTRSSPLVQFLVSSRHLILASKYFQRVLQGPWEEGTVIHPDGRRHISAQDWDEEAMLILMQVIHGRNRRVPASISLETCAKIAVLVDYYSCHEAVQVWSNVWGSLHAPSIPKIYDRNLVLQILIALVFENDELLKNATKIAVNHCKTDFPTMDLPIVVVAERINQQRQERISEIFDCIYNLRALSSEGSIGCGFECSSMLLGSLTIQMHQKGLDSKPEFPYTGYSIASVTDMIHKFETPRWMHRSHRSCYCTLSDLFEKNLSSRQVQGLELGSSLGQKLDGPRPISVNLW